MLGVAGSGRRLGPFSSKPPLCVETIRQLPACCSQTCVSEITADFSPLLLGAWSFTSHRRTNALAPRSRFLTSRTLTSKRLSPAGRKEDQNIGSSDASCVSPCGVLAPAGGDVV